ncbi:MAG: hypothetical protein JO051_10590, partial [Acidobacteriaceae bacterium]|nr:hypothetical protein [Acidobacteriaceae bacterium]
MGWLVPGEYEQVRLPVESWEIKLARDVAAFYRPHDEDLAAELYRRVAEIKAKQLTAVRDWPAFLAQSLFNAAKNVFRREDRLRRRFETLRYREEEQKTNGTDVDVVAPERVAESRLLVRSIWSALSPELQQLACMLLE